MGGGGIDVILRSIGILGVVGGERGFKRVGEGVLSSF